MIELNMTQAAKLLDCSTMTVRHYIDSGQLPARRVGAAGYHRVLLSDIEALVKKRDELNRRRERLDQNLRKTAEQKAARS